MTRESLREQPRWVLDALAWPFDFDVTPKDDAEELSWFRFPPGSQFQILASDGTGGLFGLVGSSPGGNSLVGYISSEGQCGVIADTLATAVALVVSAPYWFDLAKFSGGGRLEEMRRVVSYLEVDVNADTPEVVELRPRLLSHFNLASIADPVAALHRAIVANQQVFRVFARDGEPYGPLFNSFTVDSNPGWRGRG